MQLLLTFVVAAASGWLAERTRVPGGPLVGAMVGSAAVTLTWGDAAVLPVPLQVVTFAMVGMMVGVGVTRGRLRRLLPYAGAALASAAGLIVVGYLVAVLLEILGIAPPAVVLATSPGALSVLAAVSVEHGEGAVEVALFHLVRIVSVILLIPVVLRLRPSHGE